MPLVAEAEYVKLLRFPGRREVPLDDSVVPGPSHAVASGRSRIGHVTERSGREFLGIERKWGRPHLDGIPLKCPVAVSDGPDQIASVRLQVKNDSVRFNEWDGVVVVGPHPAVQELPCLSRSAAKGEHVTFVESDSVSSATWQHDLLLSRGTDVVAPHSPRCVRTGDLIARTL
jgi:hypothetical protein